MKYKNIQHVFFDLDHTLWDFDKNSEMAFGTIFKQHHPEIAIADFIEKYAPINQACWKLYQYDKITHEELRYKRLKDSFDALNYAISDQAIHQMAEDYITLLPDNNHLFDGAIEILEYLNSKYELHIITNGFANVQYKKIANSKIEKPNPIIYQHALDLAQAQKEHSIMIGDCLEADVQGALDFGIDALFFNPNKENKPENIIAINHLLELKNYL
jgi:putative hydrolase of the HAD superfamily